MNTTSPAAKAAKSIPTSILAGLKFSTAIKPTKADQSQRSPRSVVLEFIDQQIALAKADIDGKSFSITKTRFKKAHGSEKAERVECAVVPRRGYWREVSGESFLACTRYGNLTVEFSPCNPSIICGPKLEDVVHTFEIIRKAVEAGELDQQIAAAHARARRKKTAETVAA